jgi:SMODS-associated and fused to various effectors sensor domain
MANQVAARLAGDDYQHLYAWWHVLTLLLPSAQVAEVSIEDDQAGSFDDVTVTYEPASGKAPHYFQVKYHVDQRDCYSTQVLLDRGPGSSLLQKFWRTWKKIRAEATEPELMLFSNWSWDSTDAVGQCINGHDGSLKGFLSAGEHSNIGKLRARWLAECGGSLHEFKAFISCLRLRLGSTNAAADVSAHVADRMENLGLLNDETALLVAVGIVRGWIKQRIQRVNKELLEGVLTAHDLRSKTGEPSVTVYVETIKKRRFDLEPDYLIDWREYFVGPEHERSHRIVDPSLWNGRLLPELRTLEERINRDSTARLIRARGFARLSAWFAFGRVFSRVAGYEIEVQQGASLWRSDASPSGFTLVPTAVPESGRVAATLAVGLSITGSLAVDIRRYLESVDFRGAILELEPAGGPALDALQGAGDAVALAVAAKKQIREWLDATRATEVWLFYFGPLSGACFLGHDLNALGARVTIMEDQAPGYAPSFQLE